MWTMTSFGPTCRLKGSKDGEIGGELAAFTMKGQEVVLVSVPLFLLLKHPTIHACCRNGCCPKERQQRSIRHHRHICQIRARHAVNVHLTQTYWEIGPHIVEFEQGEKARADYGKALLNNLSRDLTRRHGKGFSQSNLKRFRRFYFEYPKGAKASHLLSWSH